jgi:hypothetical protein
MSRYRDDSALFLNLESLNVVKKALESRLVTHQVIERNSREARETSAIDVMVETRNGIMILRKSHRLSRISMNVR